MSSREDFRATWLLETPMGIGPVDSWDYVRDEISLQLKNYIFKHRKAPDPIDHNLYKIVGEQLFYWYEEDDNIQLGCVLEKRHEGLVIVSVAKDPALKGKPPFASDLFLAVLKDTDKNIRILGDTKLSDEGLSVWYTLLKKGCKISVYDSDNPGKSFKTFTSPSEIDSFFKNNDTKYERYQYVLSESENAFSKLTATFSNRRLRELSGTL